PQCVLGEFRKKESPIGINDAFRGEGRGSRDQLCVGQFESAPFRQKLAHKLFTKLLAPGRLRRTAREVRMRHALRKKFFGNPAAMARTRKSATVVMPVRSAMTQGSPIWSVDGVGAFGR